MKIIYCKDYQSMSRMASQFVIDEILLKKDLLFCAATGNSPTGMYAEMANKFAYFQDMRVVKMDEWGIIPLTHHDSCESYLRKHLLGPLEIPEKQYNGFDTAPQNVDKEIDNMKSYISKRTI